MGIFYSYNTRIKVFLFTNNFYYIYILIFNKKTGGKEKMAKTLTGTTTGNATTPAGATDGFFICRHASAAATIKGDHKDSVAITIKAGETLPLTQVQDKRGGGAYGAFTIAATGSQVDYILVF